MFAELYLEGIDIPDHQIEWYDKVLEKPEVADYDRVAIFSSRDHGKTTSMSVVLPLWRQICNPAVTQCFVGYKLDLPMLRLQRIKREVDKNKRIQEDFGLIPDTKAGWGKEALFFQRKHESIVPSMFCYGIASGGTGHHMDYMYWDDIITSENSYTKKLRESIALTVATSVYPQVEPGGQLLCVGTPKHVEDIYSSFADFQNARARNPAWRCYFYPAYDSEDPKETLWQERYPMESLQAKKEQLISEYGSLGERMYAQEYLLIPHALGGEEFKDEWLVFYDIDNPRANLDNMPHYIGVDPAVGERDTSSYCGIVTGCYNIRSERFWIRDIYREHVSLGELPSVIAGIYDRFKNRRVPSIVMGIEAVFWQASLAKFMDKHIPVQAINYKRTWGKGLDKFDRIRLLTSFFQARRITLPDASSYTPSATFINKEYRPFPQSSTLDLMDALNIMVHLPPLETKRHTIIRWK